MPEKVKRGLGLLVVALIAFLIGLVASGGDDPNAVSGMAGVIAVLLGGVGLVLVAWGLLRD